MGDRLLLSLRHDDGILQAEETVEIAINDLRCDLELTDDRDPIAPRIVNRHALSQQYIDSITHGDRGAPGSVEQLFNQDKRREPRILGGRVHESLDSDELPVEFGHRIRDSFNLLDERDLFFREIDVVEVDAAD